MLLQPTYLVETRRKKKEQNTSPIRSAMDQAFFRKSRTGNREIKLTDTEAIIPAYKKEPEVRAPLPNRRPRTLEERMADLVERKEQIAALEEEIEKGNFDSLQEFVDALNDHLNREEMLSVPYLMDGSGGL